MITAVIPYGDSALLVEVDEVSSAHRLAAAIDRSRRGGQEPGDIVDIVVGFCSVVVHLRLESSQPELVEQWLLDLGDEDDGSPGQRGDPGSVPAPSPVESDPAPSGQRRVVIPVTFDGPDLDAVAATLGTTPARIIELMTGAELRVAFVGFAPGFPYLVGLPPELASVPRRTTPRPSVPSGSVAVGGGFASVYPQTTPGGWMLLGRTSVQLFDPARPPYALLDPGDTVRFSEHSPVDRDRSPTAPARPVLAARGDRFVTVLEAGLLSLVEDGGRVSVASMGVPRAGPADPESMRLANRLVGNPDLAATIEVTAMGPTLRFTGHAHVGVVASSPEGVEVRIDGHPVSASAVSPVRDGQVLSIGRVLTGLRAYLAVAGGFETPLVVGSRSTDVLSALGPGPLVAGDQLDLGSPSRPHGLIVPPVDPATGDQPTVLRTVVGPHHPPGVASDSLVDVLWTVANESNRIGVRLRRRGPPLAPRDGGIPSTGMITGAIQLPPDGNPIILMPDHATVGGYPVIACVISADLPLVGQLRPGDPVTFAAVDRRTARSERLIRERMLAGRVKGWFPTDLGT